MGIEARFVDPSDPENFRRATPIDQDTRCYYGETLPNPKLIGVPDCGSGEDRPRARRAADHGQHGVAGACASHSSMARPSTMHSTTKYIGGHGTSIGGVIVDGGNFDWEKHADRFPMLNTPDPSYHGAVWTQAVKPLGPIAYIIKARVTLLRDIGADVAVQCVHVHPGAWRRCRCACVLIAVTLRVSRSICQKHPENHQGDFPAPDDR